MRHIAAHRWLYALRAAPPAPVSGYAYYAGGDVNSAATAAARADLPWTPSFT